MKRPLGVTLAAVVAIAGSVLAALFGLVFLVATGDAPEMEGLRGFGYFLGTFCLALGALGVATAVGLLNLRPWARSATLVFAGITAFFTLAGGAVIAFVPLPPQPGMPPVSEGALRAAVLTVYAVPFLIGVWWLWLFTRPGTVAAFQGTTPSAEPARPLIITIIGWFNIVTGAFLVAMATTSTPAMAAGFVLTGWSAALFYLFVGVVNAFLGWRLLALDERARILTIWWFVITIAHTTLLAISPGARQRLREFQAMVQPPDAPTLPYDSTSFTIAMMVVSMLLLAAAIWPLVSNRAAFDRE